MYFIGLRFIEEIKNMSSEVESKIIKEINESMISYDGYSQIELKNHKDPSTSLHIDGGFEEFFRYLDSEFKPEIDLSEDIIPKLFAGDKFNDSIEKIMKSLLIKSTLHIEDIKMKITKDYILREETYFAKTLLEQSEDICGSYLQRNTI